MNSSISMVAGEHVDAIPCGNLRIDHAAHAEVSSNQRIFEHLAISLLKLLAVKESEPTKADLLRVFPVSFTAEIPGVRL